MISPWLFNVYQEARTREGLDGVNDGVNVRKKLLQTVRFADN